MLARVFLLNPLVGFGKDILIKKSEKDKTIKGVIGGCGRRYHKNGNNQNLLPFFITLCGNIRIIKKNNYG